MTKAPRKAAKAAEQVMAKPKGEKRSRGSHRWERERRRKDVQNLSPVQAAPPAQDPQVEPEL